MKKLDRRIVFVTSRDQAAKLDALARKQGVTMGRLLRAAVAQFIEAYSDEIKEAVRFVGRGSRTVFREPRK
jgi:predicted transcriptional regulator